jgi:5-methylcytosine-specific restriction endonuclease McrA
MTLNRTARMATKRGAGLSPISKKRRAELAEQGITNPMSSFRPRPTKLPAELTRAPRMATPAKAKRRTDTGPDAATHDAVCERDGYSCCLCGGGVGDRRGTDYSIHHRKLRSQGVDNSLPNLILLCGSGSTGCHQAVHAKPKWAREFGGWILKGSDDPAAYPVLVEKADRWVLLTPGGRRVTTSAPARDEAAA